MTGILQPLASNFQIVDERGFPTLYFTQWAQQRQIDIGKAIDAAQALQIVQQFLADHPLQEGNGIDLTNGGDIGQGVQISANVQEILNQLSTTRGAILFRGASAWQALAPGSAGQFLQTAGAGADPLWATGGGGGSGGYFKGATGIFVAANTTSFATKGLVFRPSRNLTITDLHAWVDPTVLSTELYQLGVAELNSVTFGANNIVTGFTVTSVLGTTTPRNALSVNGHLFSEELTSPVSVTAGTYYIVYAARTDGTGTTILRLSPSGITDVGPNWNMNFPGETFVGFAQVNTIGLTAGQVVSGLGNGCYCLFIEGTF